ncbi:MAG TPA: 30S ribosomal protein S1 [Candidatus Deferrimicrobiaceae bacterium]
MSELEDTKVNAVEEEEDFASMFEGSFVAPVKLRPGQKIDATIVSIAPDWIFLDLGRKGEGVIDRKELLDAEGNLTVKVGDPLSAYFLSSSNSELRFTLKVVGGGGNAQIEEAFRSGIPVEGFVVKEIKGGFEVKLAGATRAFCPFSQMGLPRVKEEGEYVGKRLNFKVTQYGERGRNIVISRRAILEAERQQRQEALRDTLKEGMVVKGTITSLRDFGAFVNIGDIEGLIPISEIGWSRVADVRDVLSTGQEVEVVITQLDWVKERFTFSLKAALPDPWDASVQNFPPGSLHTGKIARLTAFGAFVSLADGVDGLIHISRLGGGKRIKHPNEVVQEGQIVEVKVESVDREKRRIALALPNVASAAQESEAESSDYKDYMSSSSTPSSSLGSLGEALKAAKMGNRDSK